MSLHWLIMKFVFKAIFTMKKARILFLNESWYPLAESLEIPSTQQRVSIQLGKWFWGGSCSYSLKPSLQGKFGFAHWVIFTEAEIVIKVSCRLWRKSSPLLQEPSNIKNLWCNLNTNFKWKMRFISHLSFPYLFSLWTTANWKQWPRSPLPINAKHQVTPYTNTNEILI